MGRDNRNDDYFCQYRSTFRFTDIDNLTAQVNRIKHIYASERNLRIDDKKRIITDYDEDDIIFDDDDDNNIGMSI